MKPKTIVVAGANGKLGELICSHLLMDPAFAQSVHVRALVRRKGDGGQAPANIQALADAYPKTMQVVSVDYTSRTDLLAGCAGAYTVVSTLQGLDDVIVDLQSALLKAALESRVRRFIPSDFSVNFESIPEGAQRNFDIRRRFHREAAAILRAAAPKGIEFTSIYQGAFTELLTAFQAVDLKNQTVKYLGSKDQIMDLTTWGDTALYAAHVCVDERATPAALCIAGDQVTPAQLARDISAAIGVPYRVRRLMPLWLLSGMIKFLRAVAPGKKEDVMPMWVGLQYGWVVGSGLYSHRRLDNDRYEGIDWQKAGITMAKAYRKELASLTQK